jgi:hypothetical protein
MIYSSHYLLAPILFCFHKDFFLQLLLQICTRSEDLQSFHIWYKEEVDKLPHK